VPAAALAAVGEEDAWSEAEFTAAARTAAPTTAVAPQQQQQQQQQQLWTVEQDMQLAEALSELADYYGEEPHNVPCAALRAALETPGSTVAAMLAAPGRELLAGIAPRNVIARMAVLRVLNARIGRALPLLCEALPEEVRHYCLCCFACLFRMYTVCESCKQALLLHVLTVVSLLSASPSMPTICFIVCLQLLVKHN
jgi:hypothetical protein